MVSVLDHCPFYLPNIYVSNSLRAYVYGEHGRGNLNGKCFAHIEGAKNVEFPHNFVMV